MSKTFTYSRQCGPSTYSEYTDEEFCDEEDFEYEVDIEEIRDALANMIFDEYFAKIPSLKENKEVVAKIKKAINDFISNNDLEDCLSESYEDELKDYFEEDAFNSLDD